MPRWWRPLPQPPFDGDRRRDPDAVARLAGTSRPPGTRSPTGSPSVRAAQRRLVHLAGLRCPARGRDRILRLVYVQSPTEPPAVTWVAGGAPQSSAGPGEDGIVAVRRRTRRGRCRSGCPSDGRVRARPRAGRPAHPRGPVRPGRSTVRVSGIYTPDDPDDPAWTVARELLSPAVGIVRRRRAHLGGGAGLAGGAARPADRRTVRPADRARHVPARPGAGALGAGVGPAAATWSSSRPRPA